MSKSFEVFKTKTKAINVVAQLNGETKYSSQAPYMRMSEDKTYWLQQLIIGLDMGKVYDYYWDNNCVGCTGACLLENTTGYVDYNNTAQNYSASNCGIPYCLTGTDCDLRILVMFSGTDKDGNHMTSAGMRLQNFQYQNPEMMYGAYQNSTIDIIASPTIVNTQAAAAVAAIN